jgi:hypothetical protein
MERNVWDGYADWAEVARAEQVVSVRQRITGHEGKWLPNTASEALRSVVRTIFVRAVLSAPATQNSQPVTVVDFGCGLGRNLPLLRQIFPRVVGIDIPEMIERLRGEPPSDPTLRYDAIYDDLDALLGSEHVHVLYDSVVLQHIVDAAYSSDLADRLALAPTLLAVVSLSNQSLPVVTLDFLTGEYRWTTVFSEIDTTSFFGHPHTVRVLRRPTRWTSEVRDDVIGIVPEGGEWRPVTLHGSPSRAGDWQVVGVLTELAPVLLVLFERAGTRAAWFVDESGRRLGGEVQTLSAATREAMRNDLRQMLAPWLFRKFGRTGFGIIRSLLDLIAPPPESEKREC